VSAYTPAIGTFSLAADGAAQALELFNAGDCVIGHSFNRASLFWLWVDSIRVGEPAAGSHRIEASFERIAAHQPEHCIDAIRREGFGSSYYVSVPAVRGHVRTQFSNEFHSGCG